MKKVLINIFAAVCALSATANLAAQSHFVDKNGIIRDARTKQETSYFGVNYTAPFAHASRMQKQFGYDIKETIEKDTYHFSRLGLTGYRIHVWDCEITDGEGNLLENERLDNFDYLVYQLEKRGIRLTLTTMFWGEDGYPDPMEDLPGFQIGWSKGEMTSNPEAIAKAEKYVANFMRHYNKYTGYTFGEDPMIIAFEINNEPSNPSPEKETTEYLNRMIRSIRSTGCKKPVFYNVSHNFQNTQAFYNSKFDGGTFQWYPSGLVANFTRKGNFLPAVDEYHIPFENIRNFDRKSKMVYEFDAADQLSSYLYPAIVRSFREAGMQWVTMFAYDPICIADINTEYQTHYLNLAYTPSKAISLKIAAEAMKALPRGVDYGEYPANNVFGDFTVNYENDLSLMNSGDKFFYSNTTDAVLKDEASLHEIAGVGNSATVKYEGSGAYFLDKVGDGLWRLEVMPDVAYLKDPFGKTSPDNKVASIMWREWPMSITLADLGTGFSFKALNEGNSRYGKAEDTTINTFPGVYLLSRNGADASSINASTPYGFIKMGEYVAPADSQKELAVLHTPAPVLTAGEDFTFTAQVIGPQQPDSVVLYSARLARRAMGPRYGTATPAAGPTVRMNRTKGSTYAAEIPGSRLTPGGFDYHIIVYTGGKAVTFPAEAASVPTDWGFNYKDIYTTTVEAPDQPVTLYTSEDFSKAEAYGIGARGAIKTIGAGAYPGTRVTKLSSMTINEGGEIFIKMYIKDKVAGTSGRLASARDLCVKFNGAEGTDSIQAGFITKDGFCYKATVPAGDGIVKIPLSSLTLTKTDLRPTQYPGFLPDYFIPSRNAPAFSVSDIETLEFGTPLADKDGAVSISFESIWLE